MRKRQEELTELNEDLKFKISVKTLIGIIVGVASVIGAWYAFDASIDSRIEEKINAIKPGKGFYQVDPADPAAKETWPPSRQEFQMRIDLTAQEITMLKEMLKEKNK
jgi:hypothetical protein